MVAPRTIRQRGRRTKATQTRVRTVTTGTQVALRPRRSGVLRENGILRISKVVGSAGMTLITAPDVSTVGAALSFNTAGLVQFQSFGPNNNYFSTAMAFCLADVPEAAQFAALYDLYKLKQVDIRIIPMSTNVISASTNGNYQVGGFVHYIVDHDDAKNFPASEIGLNQMRARKGYRMKNICRPVNLRIRPRIAVAAYENGLFSGYLNMKSGWISTADTIGTSNNLVEHYGLKFIYEMLSPGSAGLNYFNAKMEVKYHLEFKDPI